MQDALGIGLLVLRIDHGIGQCEEVRRDVLEGIEDHPAGQQPTAVESLLVEGVEADAVRGAADDGEQRGEAREEFQVDDGVDAVAPRPAPETRRVATQMTERVPAQAEDTFGRNRAEQTEARPVVFEDGEEELGFRQVRLDLAHGRVGQDGAAHLGELDQQDPPGRDVGAWRRAAHEGAESAERNAQPPVQRAHAGNRHRCLSAPNDCGHRSRSSSQGNYRRSGIAPQANRCRSGRLPPSVACCATCAGTEDWEAVCCAIS